MPSFQRFRGEGVRAAIREMDANMQGLNRFARKFGTPPDVEKSLRALKGRVGDLIAMMQMGQKRNHRD
jgi:hypothetical protein